MRRSLVVALLAIIITLTLVISSSLYSPLNQTVMSVVQGIQTVNVVIAVGGITAIAEATMAVVLWISAGTEGSSFF